MGFTDSDGEVVPVPYPPADGSHYGAIGAFQGTAYRRNAFAQHTEQEVEVLVEVLKLRPGHRILDVGCGNGRHVAHLRHLGHDAVGVDLAPALLIDGVSRLVAGRAQQLPFAAESFDRIISVCQGGFGLSEHEDRQALSEWVRVLRAGGRLALTAFSLVFAARYMDDTDALDVERGLHHHLADVTGPDGRRRTFDLWTAAYSVPHLRQLLEEQGLNLQGTAGVEPGGFQSNRGPGTTDPEILMWADRM